MSAALMLVTQESFVIPVSSLLLGKAVESPWTDRLLLWRQKLGLSTQDLRAFSTLCNVLLIDP